VVKLTVWNDAAKPPKGRIKHWTRLGECVSGFYVDHPEFKNKWGNTTEVVSISPPTQFGYRELETQHSRYTLVGEELTWEEFVKKRQALENENHAQAYRLLSPRPKPVHVQGDTAHSNNNKDNKKRNGKPTYYTRAIQTRVASRNNPK
jgi:hypothetical protein